MLKRIKRLILSFQIYALDIEIHSQTETLAMCIPLHIRARVEAARYQSRKERTRLRGLYIETFPVGERRIYDAA